MVSVLVFNWMRLIEPWRWKETGETCRGHERERQRLQTASPQKVIYLIGSHLTYSINGLQIDMKMLMNVALFTMNDEWHGLLQHKGLMLKGPPESTFVRCKRTISSWIHTQSEINLIAQLVVNSVGIIRFLPYVIISHIIRLRAGIQI